MQDFKMIPSEQVESGIRKTKRNKDKRRPKTRSSASVFMQKKYTMELNNETKTIRAVGYKLINNAQNLANLPKNIVDDLVQDMQRSILYLHKYRRKKINKRHKK